VRLVLFGHRGKVGSVLLPALERAGHDVQGVGRGDAAQLEGIDVAVEFTTPEGGLASAEAVLGAGVPVVVGTTGLDLEALDAAAREAGQPAFHAPNFAVGAVLMMRFAAEAAALLPRAEIVELHSETKRDAPSGTATATAALLPGDTPIHSVRLPGLVAHQEVILGGEGQTLTIRHDTYAREAFVPGVLLALERVRDLPAGLTVGLDALF
jgi:4-hydroxy-tetrahydrodipicolinate reductase